MLLVNLFNNKRVTNTGAIQTEANFLSFYFQLASWESASAGVVSIRARGSNGLTPGGSYSSFKSHKQDIHLNWNWILYMVHSFKSAFIPLTLRALLLSMHNKHMQSTKYMNAAWMNKRQWYQFGWAYCGSSCLDMFVGFPPWQWQWGHMS